MINLFILRHGQAQPLAATDSARELTSQGKIDVERVVRDNIHLPIEKIYSSPYLRAQQTAKICEKILSSTDCIITCNELTPDADPSDIIAYITRQTSKNLLLVSHQPLVGDLVALCVKKCQPIPFQPAGLAWVTFENEAQMGRGKLQWVR
jgi:phosphohistidine phosphatase